MRISKGSKAALWWMAVSLVGCSRGQPPFLKDTRWPPALRLKFDFYSASSQGPPVKSGPNFLDYSFPAEKDGKTDGKLHSFYQSCPPFPCVPTSFLQSSSQEPLPCHFYIFRDPDRNGSYAAYVYSEHWRQYALFVAGLGPMHPDFLARYYRVNPVQPQPTPPPASDLPVGNPPGSHMRWFRAAGFGGYPETEDVFGVFAVPVHTAQGSYRRPFSFGGKHGQLVYSDWNPHPDFTPSTFQPPAGYQQAPHQVAHLNLGGLDITLDCPVRFPFDLYDKPLVTDNGHLEPIRETVMVCTACHAFDPREGA